MEQLDGERDMGGEFAARKRFVAAAALCLTTGTTPNGTRLTKQATTEIRQHIMDAAQEKPVEDLAQLQTTGWTIEVASLNEQIEIFRPARETPTPPPSSEPQPNTLTPKHFHALPMTIDRHLPDFKELIKGLAPINDEHTSDYAMRGLRARLRGQLETLYDRALPNAELPIAMAGVAHLWHSENMERPRKARELSPAALQRRLTTHFSYGDQTALLASWGMPFDNREPSNYLGAFHNGFVVMTRQMKAQLPADAAMQNYKQWEKEYRKKFPPSPR